MSEILTQTRYMCMRQTNQHFFLVANRPYSVHSEGFSRLMRLGGSNDYSIHSLSEGAQVFVYPREDFKMDEFGKTAKFGLSNVGLFQERVILEAQQMGGRIAIDPHVTRVDAKVQPVTDPEKMVVV